MNPLTLPITCNLKPNCTAAGSEYGRPAEERKVSRGEYQKAKDAVKKALDEKVESGREVGYAGRELDKAQSTCGKIMRNR